MRVEVNARGLNAEEIQQAIDSQVNYKKMSTQTIIEDAKMKYIELIKLDKKFAVGSVDAIKKYHPELLKKV